MIIIIASVGVVYAAFFSQTLPTINVPKQLQLVACSTSPIPETQPSPGSGVILFDCGSSTAAFTVSNGPGMATPTFTIPTNPSTISTSLGITLTPATTCVGATITPLTSGTPLNLQDGGYDYCLGYSAVPVGGGTIGPVTISWS